MKTSFEPLTGEIVAYCRENGDIFPYAGKYFVQKDNKDKIVGVLGVGFIPMIEPLLADNAFIANNLVENAIGFFLTNNQNRIEAFTEDERLAKLQPMFEKKGFFFLEKTNRFIKHIDNKNA